MNIIKPSATVAFSSVHDGYDAKFGVADINVVSDAHFFRYLIDARVLLQIHELNELATTTEGNEFCDFVEPPGMTQEQGDLWLNSCLDAEGSYELMVAHGADPDTARSVLPDTAKIEFSMVGSLREWKRFVTIDREKVPGRVKPTITAILDVLKELEPTTFNDCDKPE